MGKTMQARADKELLTKMVKEYCDIRGNTASGIWARTALGQKILDNYRVHCDNVNCKKLYEELAI